LEEQQGEAAVSEPCSRQGIHPTIFDKWLKDFMKAGKGRGGHEAGEVRRLREESERLKQLVAELSLANLTLEKSPF
jgi:transposase-like protein